jgi:DNA polymerase/3'-5' exonuclease PolX
VLSLIRTGPADFARRFVTRRCRGGVLPDWAQVKEGGIYHQGEFRPIPTPEEEDVFRLLGLGVIPPSYRLSGESWPHLVYGV